jgi:hypothetical protein
MICNPYEIIIEGMTHEGKVFRPSDWAERLCGILASFGSDQKLAYHEYVRPMMLGDVRCVAIDRKLEKIHPSVFEYLMSFAKDNHLQVVDCRTLLDTVYSREHSA